MTVLKPIFIFPLPGTQVPLGHFAGEWMARLPRTWKTPKENKSYPFYLPKEGGEQCHTGPSGLWQKIRLENKGRAHGEANKD